MAVYDFVRNQLVTSLGQDFPPPGLMFFLDEWQKHRTEKEPRLRPADMRDVVERALATLQGLYVHLDLKRARRGVDPLSQLRMFKDRITALEPRDSRAFHDIMLPSRSGMFMYRLPEQDQCHRLPPLMSVYFDGDNRRRYLVTHYPRTSMIVRSETASKLWDEHTPIDEAVHLNTEFEEGNNEPHDLALALQFMTVRWLGASYEPDSPWVFVAFKTPDGRTRVQLLNVRSERWTRIIVTISRGHRVWHLRPIRPTGAGGARQQVLHNGGRVFAAAKPDDRPTQEKLNKVAEQSDSSSGSLVDESCSISQRTTPRC